MGNALNKRLSKLEMRQKDFDSMRDTAGRKRPGSMNLHKQSGGSSSTLGKRR